MNLPIEHRQTPSPADDRFLNRLVDGELSDVERRDLLLRFENEPDGWRRCALAFLEDQNWRETFGPLAATAPATARPVIVPDNPGRKLGSWRPAARLTGLAASLVLAFALGWALRSEPAQTAPDARVAKGAISLPATPPEPPQPAPTRFATQEARPSKPAESPTPFDAVVKSWEHRGYRAETQKRLVSMELKDGRKLDLPVHEVRLRYVGGRTY
jgi:hypothetical protein